MSAYCRCFLHGVFQCGSAACLAKLCRSLPSVVHAPARGTSFALRPAALLPPTRRIARRAVPRPRAATPGLPGACAVYRRSSSPATPLAGDGLRQHFSPVRRRRALGLFSSLRFYMVSWLGERVTPTCHRLCSHVVPQARSSSDQHTDQVLSRLTTTRLWCDRVGSSLRWSAHAEGVGAMRCGSSPTLWETRCSASWSGGVPGLLGGGAPALARQPGPVATRARLPRC